MDEQLLIAAVLADPEDDAPRLIYADWLDEQGECDRAGLVRVCCAMRRLPCRCRLCALEKIRAADIADLDAEIAQHNASVEAGGSEPTYTLFGRAVEWPVYLSSQRDMISGLHAIISAAKCPECKRAALRARRHALLARHEVGAWPHLLSLYPNLVI
jgi:uncharacterized protein (TIGR02996 family)